MQGDADISKVATLIGDRTRARFLLQLARGDGMRASELAAAAGVSRATASSHLAKLLSAGVIDVQAQGRHRSYRLAGQDVAHAIEALMRIAPREQTSSLRGTANAQALAYARFCYDHLAGRLAIQLVDAMSASGVIVHANGHFEPTGPGERWFAGMGIDVDALRAKRRSFARSCLDWSERRPHLAGALGAALAQRLLAQHWIKRAPEGRAVTLTPEGRAGLKEILEFEDATHAGYVPCMLRANE